MREIQIYFCRNLVCIPQIRILSKKKPTLFHEIYFENIESFLPIEMWNISQKKNLSSLPFIGHSMCAPIS